MTKGALPKMGEDGMDKVWMCIPVTFAWFPFHGQHQHYSCGHRTDSWRMHQGKKSLDTFENIFKIMHRGFPSCLYLRRVCSVFSWTRRGKLSPLVKNEQIKLLTNLINKCHLIIVWLNTIYWSQFIGCDLKHLPENVSARPASAGKACGYLPHSAEYKLKEEPDRK